MVLLLIRIPREMSALLLQSSANGDAANYIRRCCRFWIYTSREDQFWSGGYEATRVHHRLHWAWLRGRTFWGRHWSTPRNLRVEMMPLPIRIDLSYFHWVGCVFMEIYHNFHLLDRLILGKILSKSFSDFLGAFGSICPKCMLDIPRRWGFTVVSCHLSSAGSSCVFISPYCVPN